VAARGDIARKEKRVLARPARDDPVDSTAVSFGRMHTGAPLSDVDGSLTRS
jgi:hypothetical protein